MLPSHAVWSGKTRRGQIGDEPAVTWSQGSAAAGSVHGLTGQIEAARVVGDGANRAPGSLSLSEPVCCSWGQEEPMLESCVMSFGPL